MLSASPLVVGAVYVEKNLGSDALGDAFEVTFQGGAPETELARLTISGDQNEPGFGVGDVFFDAVESGLGADKAFPLTIHSQAGIDDVRWHVEDGTSLLVLDFQGFQAGDKLVFSIDVDEVEEWDAAETDLTLVNEGFDPITSGVEFQSSLLTAQFTARHYRDASGTASFRNRYDDALAGTGLDLPADDENGNRDRTAGAVLGLEQIAKPITISGTVYDDADLDRTQGGAEPGIAGVTLSLWTNEDGSYVFTGQTTTTDSDGNYQFGRELDLLPGTYQVRESQPNGFFSVAALPGTVAGSPVGQTIAGDADTLSDITIPLGDQHAIDYDFAEARPASIGGHVFHDRDNDGVRDPGEEAIAGVQIHILPVDTIAPLATVSVTTNDDGSYQATGLPPGTYHVVQPVQPAKFLDGTDTAGTVDGAVTGTAINPGDRIENVVLQGGSSGEQYDFGELRPTNISGYVYHDRDNDGVRDPGEEPIAGAAITVEPIDTIVPVAPVSLTTDSDGFYDAGGLPPGMYRVVQTVQPAGFLDGQDTAGTVNGTASGRPINPGDRIEDIVLASGQSGTQYNFGELRPTSINGRVHLSSDGDCVTDGDHEPVEGVTVVLQDDGGREIARTTTDAGGEYWFDGLDPGTYTIIELQPDGLLEGDAHTGTIDGRPAGVVSGGSTVRTIVLASGQVAVDVDFCEHLPASLAGFVYHDENQSGQRDGGEDAIQGVTVVLRDAGRQQVDTRLTDGAGHYQFDRLPAGTYTIQEVQPDGWLDGQDSAGTIDGVVVGQAASPGDEIRQVTIKWGERGVNYNFAELLPGSIEGTVYSDLNQNVAVDPGEQPIEGVRVQLLDTGGTIVGQTETDAQGHYRFDTLVPGAYTVQSEHPSEFFHSGQQAGTGDGDASVDDLISEITIGSDRHLTGYDFFETPAATLSGFVFQDGPVIMTTSGELQQEVFQIRDGRRTADDKPLAGVVLELRHGLTGAPITADTALPGHYGSGPIRTTTDARGAYEFAGLPRGTYAVFEIHPEGFIDGIDTPGTTSGIAVNAGQPIGSGVLTSLTVDPKFDAILRIPLLAGAESRENNFSEVLVGGRFELPPPVTLSTPIPQPIAPPIIAAPPPLAPDFAPPVTPVTRSFEIFGAGGQPYTWHLSVVDAGRPRGVADASPPEIPVWPAATYLSNTAWQGGGLDQARWSLSGTMESEQDLTSTREHLFGMPGAVPVTGDFNGDGITEMGVFYNGQWFIDLNGNGRWDEGDLWARLGRGGDVPVTGDWDGDGKDDIGIFGPAWVGDARAVAAEPGLPDPQNVPSGAQKNIPPAPRDATQGERLIKLTSAGQVRADVVDHVFRFGASSRVPVTGDWNGDGIDTIGVFHGGRWHLDTDGDGRWSEADTRLSFGQGGDVPVVGDWSGNGVDQVGVFRDGQWILDTNGNREVDAHDRVFTMGGADDMPVVGDWDGDGADEVGIYRPGSAGHSAN